MSKCTLCDRPRHARGYCESHYKRFMKYGDPTSGRPPSVRGATLEERFWAKVDRRGPDECWPWTAATNGKGYGMLADGARGSEGAHRVAYRLHYGDLRPDHVVDHSCHDRNCAGGNECPHRRCVNPAHLRAIVPETNVALGVSFSATNAIKTHCIHGHALTPDNSYGYKGRRQCKTCARASAKRQSADPKVKALKRERYAAARAAGYSPKDAALMR